MAEAKKDNIYEVVFSWREVVGKKTTTEVIGPVTVPARTERVANTIATLRSVKELANADESTLDVSIKEF